MRKRLLAVILSVFMIGAVFPVVAHAGPPDFPMKTLGILLKIIMGLEAS